MNTYLLRDLLTIKINKEFKNYALLGVVEKDSYTIWEIVDMMRIMTSYGVMRISKSDISRIHTKLLSNYYDLVITGNKANLCDNETGLVNIIYLDLNSSWLVDYLIEMAM
jgi:hypothetical protein